MKSWKRIEPTVVNKIGYRTVVTKTFIEPNGSVQDFQTFDQEGTHHAGIIALTEDNLAIVARQFRVGPQKVMDEIAGGQVEPGEDYQAAAIRELAEETGYRPAKVESLGQIYKDAYTNSTHHYYLATGCQLIASGQHLDDDEYVEVRLISIDDFIANAQSGRMTDTLAVFLAYERLISHKTALIKPEH
jgi:ADP-ribose pyrophosphatase